MLFVLINLYTSIKYVFGIGEGVANCHKTLSNKKVNKSTFEEVTKLWQ